MKRIATALVLIPLAVLAVLRAQPLLFAALVAVVAVAAAWELYGLAKAFAVEPYRGVGLVAAFLLVISLQLGGAPPGASWPLLVVVATVLALLLRALSAPARMNRSLPDVAITLFGLLYPALFLGLLVPIRGRPAGPWWILFLFIVVWGGDTAAYYVGRSLGKHRLAPRVSPKKTWEGAIASALFAGVLGAAMAHWAPALSYAAFKLHISGEYLLAPYAAGDGFLLALLLNVVAQAGDLVESVLKRGAGVKDSGTLLPGHGGVLDRVDALLLATPVLWYYLLYRSS